MLLSASAMQTAENVLTCLSRPTMSGSNIKLAQQLQLQYISVRDEFDEGWLVYAFLFGQKHNYFDYVLFTPTPQSTTYHPENRTEYTLLSNKLIQLKSKSNGKLMAFVQSEATRDCNQIFCKTPNFAETLQFRINRCK